MRQKHKRGVWSPVGVIIWMLIAVVCIIVLYQNFGKIIGVFFDIDGEDKNTIEAFNVLNQGITGLLEQPSSEKTCASTLSYYSLGEKYALLGFDRGPPEQTYLVDSCNDHHRLKPSLCDEHACLCLYNTKKWSKLPETNDETREGLVNHRCRILPGVDHIIGPGGEAENEVGNLGASKELSFYLMDPWGYEHLLLFGKVMGQCPAPSEGGSWQSQAIYLELVETEEATTLFIARHHADPESRTHQRQTSCENYETLET